MGISGQVLAANLGGKVVFQGNAAKIRSESSSAVESIKTPCDLAQLKESLQAQLKLGEDNGVAHAIVYATFKDTQKRVAPSEGAPFIFHQNCMFDPPMFAMQEGESFQVLNLDPSTRRFTILMGNEKVRINADPGSPRRLKLQPPELPSIVKLQAESHPFDVAYAGIFANSYFAVTDENGRFTMEHMPEGEYELHAWHPFFGEALWESNGAESDKSPVLTLEIKSQEKSK